MMFTPPDGQPPILLKVRGVLGIFTVAIFLVALVIMMIAKSQAGPGKPAVTGPTLADVQKVVSQFQLNDFIVLRSTGCVLLASVEELHSLQTDVRMVTEPTINGFWLAGHPDAWYLAAYKSGRNIQSNEWNSAASHYFAQKPGFCKLE